ncbi:nucleotidyltransferase family protein [Providencia sp. CRE-3FA-0001]|uniref:Nucleotidyltransferase family protein n=2 Tax=Providencia TaxID=586 RepID=A0AA42FKX2_9GAMM|nr:MULTISPECIES: nucleotidyltransferase family protein [Providencia]EIU9516680.1 nucleotidyltransferase family protein [Providencia rettgeri]EJD6664147.1 nucleotidyltransferase family protein [Providencia rettgeri]ELR5095441.1 nucleotidyltransferase family protein [Providencia rettgeri]ELR5174181.1 nucleotidyltransferase family protein [Providencia rettgeri]ELR5197025.1 nucleotidyltransferase family protein [Providencia rettgeri]
MNNWEKVIVSPQSTIRNTLSILNETGLQIAMVADDNNNLIGVITDGDIRRGLLRNICLTDSVSTIMNTNPITANIKAHNNELKEIMESNGILSIPLLKDGKVVGLESLHHINKKNKYQNPVFIMAGGFGTRLRPLTDNCPKPMLTVGTKPILEIIIDNFVKAGFNNFYISTHYMPEQIKNHFGNGENKKVNITYVHEENPLGTGGALGLLPKDIPEDLPIIVMNGDVLTKIDLRKLLDFHISNNADATMCVREYDYQIPYGVINSEGNKITSMVEKPIQRFFINTGIYVISQNIIKSVPQNHRIDMPTLLEQHIAMDKNILMFPIHEYWLDIGRMDDFNRAQKDIYSLGIL